MATFLTSMASVPANAPTACTGWTAHHVAAHLAAGFEEVYVLIENSLAGRPSRDTRTFDEREAPYLAMDADALREVLRDRLTTTAKVLADFRAAGPDAVFDFNGHSFTAAQMSTHLDSELAIHRWDFMGEDAISEELLSEPAFTRHAVFLLNALPMLAEGAPNRVAGTGLRAGTVIVLRTPGQPDVALKVDTDGEASYLHGDSAGSITGQFVVTTDAANRLLTMWGRHSSRRQIIVSGNPAQWGAVAAALWPDVHEWPQG
ncbi:maleylpyruvate isomerase N-terminal domain-containing protein [Mycobacterium yunnanensis]|uniref:Maleylpyruvate isomerase N-terminal domain-containing protein n=1 Tax=Mycobacterium yunnanensis TaxID=368477 RepID=A0A9X3C426_9MYCO|nr:maleylpyruvate isomerase N-terminal domain-containing protein [Mycobacterium yunnanensis]MCV7423921.1 maleylpyruvate isomerase N-terminal domain-containing protein [Mycobacterium yunnanensis]